MDAKSQWSFFIYKAVIQVRYFQSTWVFFLLNSFLDHQSLLHWWKSILVQCSSELCLLSTLVLISYFFFIFFSNSICGSNGYKAHIPLNGSIIYFIKTISLSVGHTLKWFLKWVYKWKRKHHLGHTKAPTTWKYLKCHTQDLPFQQTATKLVWYWEHAKNQLTEEQVFFVPPCSLNSLFTSLLYWEYLHQCSVNTTTKKLVR